MYKSWRWSFRHICRQHPIAITSAKCLVHSFRKYSQIPKPRKPLALIHMDNARVHTARAAQEKLNVSRFKHMPQPPYSPDIAPSDFFFSVGWKPSLKGENGEDELYELYELLNGILTDLSIEMIETIFLDWMNRLQRLIDGNGDYVSWNITYEFLNWIKQWEAC
jgi:hypothetical protein